MTKLTDLQQSQINLLKSIVSLSEVRINCIPLQDQQSEVERQIDALEEDFKDGLKVIWQMQNADYPSILISNALKSLPCTTQTV